VSNRPGFDEIGAAVSGLLPSKVPDSAEAAAIVPIADNVVGWLGTTGFSLRCAGVQSKAAAIESSFR